MRLCVIGFDLNSSAQFLDRCRIITLLPECHPECVMRIGLRGIEFRSSAELFDRFVQLILQFQR